MNNTVILIPSRLAATRLPNKPLLKINNVSIINHVYKIAKSSLVGQCYVATGDKEIFEEVTKNGGKCILTQSDHVTGTDRIYEAFQKLENDNIEYVVNLQGDEPMLDIRDINNLITKTIEKKSKVSTLACEIENEGLLSKKNIVKVITNEKLGENKLSTAVSFSREVSKTTQNIYHHIGIYGFTKEALSKYINLKRSKLELDRNLEQMRALENKMKIHVGFVENCPLSVDTEEDLKNVQELMK